MIAKVLLCVLVVIASVCAVQQITSEQFRCLRACKREDLPAQSCLDLCVPSYEDAEVESDSEQAAPITGTLIWESYMAELFGFLKRGGSIKGLQLLKTPVPATWNTNASALAAFGNNITQWGVEYNPTAKQFPHEYIAFLKNIKVNNQKVDASTQQRINELKQSIEQLKTNIETETAQCKERHARYERLRGPTDFSEYENRFCSRIVTSRELLTVNEVTLQQTLSSVPGADVAAAIEAFNAAEGVYGWTESFIQKLSTFLTKIETNKADTFGIVVTKSSSSQSKQTKEWSWESLETGKNNEFLPTTISGSSHSMNTSADNFKMEIEAKGYYAIEVAPGKWFDMSVLKKYANGPFIDSSKKYFGADGRMPLLTQRVYLLYKPTVSLFLEKVDAQYIESVSKVSANIKLGPFTTESKSLKVTPVPSSTLYKVSLSNNDETPVVVALDNLVLP